jgi:predicted AlkP superfamily pyrophosphatase or phosphodiesterase
MKRQHLVGMALLGLALALLLLAPVGAGAQPPARPPLPKLVVMIVIDQFPYEFLNRFDPWFGSGGFRRLTGQGATFTSAHYTHLATFTGPGHATLATGSHPNKHGIVTNRYYNRETKVTTSSLYDAEAPMLNSPPLTPADDTSPRALVGTTLGDQLRLATGMKGKVFGLGLKDRGAILSAGRLGTAFWNNEGTGRLTTSRFYAERLPAWVEQINAERIPEAAFGKTWELLLPPDAYRFGPDDGPGENGGRGLGRTFPHPIHGGLTAPGPEFYEAWVQTPWSVEYQFQVAERCLLAEGLGTDDVPDLLGLCLSSPDYAGHGFGPDSWEVQDLIVRLDRALAGFLDRLAGRFQPGQLTVVLTADHGAGPLPERMASLRYPAGRIKKATVKATIETALDAQFGDGDWVLAQEEPSVFLNRVLMAERKLVPAAVERAAGEAAMQLPGFAWYFTRTGLMHGPLPDTTLALQAERSFSPERSGDLFLVPKPFYYWSSYGERDAGATHGSPYEYDTHVPLVLWGAGVRPGQYAGPAQMVDVAPTLAQLLRIGAPSNTDGRARSEALQ